MRCADRLSRAKVNIGLKIMGKREDGYHDLDTYFHLISLADRLHFEYEEAPSFSVRIHGNESYLEEGKTDLIEKAARLFSSLSGLTFSLDVTIEKHIPSQAGLGGGSGNASVTLTCINEFAGYPLSHDDLMKASLALGSDVPFFTSGFCCAHATGRGEILTQKEAVDLPALIVIRKGDRVSTSQAFRLADQRKETKIPLAGWNPDFHSWSILYHNDFDCIQPVLEDEDFLEIARTVTYFSTSGSGSSQLLVMQSIEERERICELFSEKDGKFNIIKTGFCKNIHSEASF